MTCIYTRRNIEDLQRQNEKLLAVVRELSEEQEEKERETLDIQTKVVFFIFLPHMKYMYKLHFLVHIFTYMYNMYLQEIQSQLQTALQEVDDLRVSRERQKEMVSAIVKQRDMYRTLLAQSTPLPTETPGSKEISVTTPDTKEMESVAMVVTPSKQTDLETTQALKVQMYCTCTLYMYMYICTLYMYMYIVYTMFAAVAAVHNVYM